MDQRPSPVTDLGDDSAAVLGLPRPSTRSTHAHSPNGAQRVGRV